MLAEHAGLYEWVKTFHILAAITWVGGAIYGQVLAIRIFNGSDPVVMRGVVAAFEWTGNRVMAPASLVLLALGTWMVILEPAWTFGQFWVLAALGMFAYSFVSGALYLGPQLGKVKRLWDQEGIDSPAAGALVRRLFKVSRIELALLILIVFDMVLKPGL
jgi:uncharacterized membrane protein